jgi:hypothetical protein
LLSLSVNATLFIPAGIDPRFSSRIFRYAVVNTCNSTLSASSPSGTLTITVSPPSNGFGYAMGVSTGSTTVLCATGVLVGVAVAPGTRHVTSSSAYPVPPYGRSYVTFTRSTRPVPSPTPASTVAQIDRVMVPVADAPVHVDTCPGLKLKPELSNSPPYVIPAGNVFSTWIPVAVPPVICRVMLITTVAPGRGSIGEAVTSMATPGTGVCDAVAVGVAEGEEVGDAGIEGDEVAVDEEVAVLDIVAVGDNVHVRVMVYVRVTVGVGVSVGVEVGTGVLVSVWVDVGVGVNVWVDVSVAVLVKVGVLVNTGV